MRQVEEYRTEIVSFSDRVEQCKGCIRLGMREFRETVRRRMAALKEVRRGGGCG